MTRHYEGRPLPRPGEELVDQGLAFDVGTLMSRRRTLRVLGLGAATLGLAACTDGGPGEAAATEEGEIPQETAGPFPGDGSNGPDVLEQSGVIREDIRSSFGDASGTAEGVPMTLRLTIRNLADDGASYEGAAVYVWQCDRDGNYSMYSDAVTDQNYLRGVQIADASGVVSFTTIFPGCYPGRWPHIHFEVYPDQASITESTNAITTSQVALPQDVCEKVYAEDGYGASVTHLGEVSLDTDMVFRDDRAVRQLATVTGDVAGGLTAALDVDVR